MICLDRLQPRTQGFSFFLRKSKGENKFSVFLSSRHLLYACVFVSLRIYTILLRKAEAKTIDFSDCWSNLMIIIVD